MPLSKEKIEQIRKDAEERYSYTKGNVTVDHINFNQLQEQKIAAYIAGATAEAQKALCLIEALEKLLPIANALCSKCCPDDLDLSGYDLATAALQSYTNSLK